MLALVVKCLLLTVHLIEGSGELSYVHELKLAVPYSVSELKNGLVELSGCTCPGYTLTYECTVMGGPGGATVWHGTSFNCTMSDHEIVLLHSRFESNTGTLRMCSNGAIVGRSLRVENNGRYTSQLNVTVSSDMTGESIECAHDHETTDTIGS